MAKIEITDLNKSYGMFQALRDISLDIADGEFVVLVGPSGCGKSTLLRSVAGLIEATSGIITFDGQPVNHLPPQERNVAMVFQNYALYPHMTVEQNIAFSLKFHGTPKSEITNRVKEAAALLGLEEFLHRRPSQLSGGQRQRVAMGRAMVRNANAFLFDEPLSNLDAKLRVQMRGEIRRLQKTLDATAIYVTHDQVEAMTMGDRIVVMNDGRIEQVGRPLDIYRQPINRFVAAFIGSPPMNFIDAHADGTTAHIADGQVIDLPIPANGPMVIGIRPEHLTIKDSPSSNTLKARISQRHDQGSATTFQCSIGEVHLEVQHQGIAPTQSEDIFIRANRDHLFVFDPDGNRMN